MSDSVRHSFRLTIIAGILAAVSTVSGHLVSSLQAADRVEPAVTQLTAAPTVAGRTPAVLLFDTTTLTPDQIARAVASSLQWVDQSMTSDQITAIVAITPTLRVLSDFTSNRAELRTALEQVASNAPAASAAAPSGTTADVPLQSVATLCRMIAPIAQRKSVLYFSARLNGPAAGTQKDLRTTTDACNQSNVSLYPIDARGLAIVLENAPRQSRPSLFR